MVWQREEVAAANSSPSGDRGLAPPAEGDDAEIEALLRALPTDLLSPKTPAKSSEPQATWPLPQAPWTTPPSGVLPPWPLHSAAVGATALPAAALAPEPPPIMHCSG